MIFKYPVYRKKGSNRNIKIKIKGRMVEQSPGVYNWIVNGETKPGNYI